MMVYSDFLIKENILYHKRLSSFIVKETGQIRGTECTQNAILTDTEQQITKLVVVRPISDTSVDPNQHFGEGFEDKNFSS